MFTGPDLRYPAELWFFFNLIILIVDQIWLCLNDFNKNNNNNTLVMTNDLQNIFNILHTVLYRVIEQNGIV